MNSDLIPFAQLCIGDRFLRIGAPHMVLTKTSHTWASLLWKGHRTDTPIHPADLVRLAPVGQLNPGEPRK